MRIIPLWKYDCPMVWFCSVMEVLPNCGYRSEVGEAIVCRKRQTVTGPLLNVDHPAVEVRLSNGLVLFGDGGTAKLRIWDQQVAERRCGAVKAAVAIGQ